MEQEAAPAEAHAPAVREKRQTASKRLWRRIRQPLARSRFTKAVLVSLLSRFLQLVRLTNPLVKGSTIVADGGYEHLQPGIIALWHGQHLMAPVFYPKGRPLVAMVSRSADAELNALVVEKFGIEAVRGSGGRDNTRHLDKGGAKALIALKKSLVAGKNVAMIADIPHGTPRDAGLGVILLARLSGCPILPAAMTTSRRKVLEKSWDKTTINLPFGRSSFVIGTPVFVPKDADDAEMERKRQELTASLDEATAKAYALVDAAQ